MILNIYIKESIGLTFSASKSFLSQKAFYLMTLSRELNKVAIRSLRETETGTFN